MIKNPIKVVFEEEKQSLSLCIESMHNYKSSCSNKKLCMV